ncbi:SDR family NAD(P)-dependent oxidoreductase [Nocardioides alcanivorans]|uniref:SDR family NAD(P)-dependent oxidoreductase n=1 Tax=Nocardioides alcanivorans TaxID=2897352 RepID=UPI001F1E0612|nr:SDR family NAD(P)-dependent oxidoreductase [Nocardioides alcanivorans]
MPHSQHPDTPLERIDPDELAIAIKVLRQIPELHPDHDDVRTMKRAASYMYKLIKKSRRAEIRLERQKHDQEIIEKTATGSAMRIDDETAGIPLVSNAEGAFAGELITARGCYICKQDFTLVDAFYHWLCPSCAAMSHTKRNQRTDLTGKRALLTGGRAKIGMYIALRLLRDGAHTTITTRFPKDAVRRFSAMEDSAQWLHRLKIVGIDLRDPTQVISLTEDVAADGPLDILINNACQTVRRSPAPTPSSWRWNTPRCCRSSRACRCRRWSPSTGSPRHTPLRSPAPSSSTQSRITRANRWRLPWPPRTPPP